MRVVHPERSPDISELLGVLDRHGVRYVLAGSIATLVYGVDVGYVGDLDIVLALDYENLRRLEAVLLEIEAGIDPDEPFGHWETQPDSERKWVADEPTPELIAKRANWSPDPHNPATFDSLYSSRLGNFDVVPEVSGTYETLIKRAIPAKHHGYDIIVVHVNELLAALTVPRRKKDVSRSASYAKSSASEESTVSSRRKASRREGTSQPPSGARGGSSPRLVPGFQPHSGPCHPPLPPFREGSTSPRESRDFRPPSWAVSS